MNLGLRYDFDVPRWETQDRMSYWDLEAQSPIQVAGYDTRGVFRFVDRDRRSPFDADMNNLQPRIGVAYALDPKTSIRAAYGLFFTLSRATVFGHTGGGFNVNSTPSFTLDSNATRYATLADPYPNGMLLPPGRSLGERTFLGLGAGTILPGNNRNPEYHSWNLSVQLHGQPRHAPLRPVHLADSARSEVLVDGAYGARRPGAEPLLRAHHRSESDQPEPADRAAGPPVAAHAAVRRRQHRDVGAPAWRLLLPCAPDEVGEALRARLEHAGPLHLVEDDRQLLEQLGQYQLARGLDQPPVHLGPARRALPLRA